MHSAKIKETRPLRGDGFNLLSYFTWRGLLVLAVIAIASTFILVQIVYRSRFREVYLELEKEEADSIAEDIVRRLGPMGLNSRNWGTDPVSLAAEREVQHKLENFDIVEFSFIARDGSILTLLGPEDKRRAGEWDEGLKSAANGIWASRWENDSPWTLLSNPDEAGIVETYVPVLDHGKVIAVAHIRRDLSKIGLRSHRLLPQLIAVSVLIAVVMFLALWVMIRKADSIIRQQRLQIAEIALQLERRNKFLEEYDQRKDEFLSVCSHDVRSPLASILAGFTLLLTGRKGPLSDQQRDVLERGFTNAKAVISLTDELLDLARIDAGQEALEITRFDLCGVVRDSIAAHQSQAEPRGVLFKLLCPDDGLMVEADRLKILRVCNNLISNAVKYSAAGFVVIEIAESGDSAGLTVTDNGPGLSAEEQKKLFDRFSALSRHKTSRADGTGLGLSIARALVEMHRGRIGVRSEIGRGAAFTVILPLHAPAIVQSEAILHAS